jgi:hypothetical protein
MHCAAANVDPKTCIQDLNISEVLRDAFDHADFGTCADVIEPGEIAPGDSVSVAG